MLMISLAVPVASPAVGEGLSPALHLAFDQGLFDEAATEARAIASADAKAFAARSLLAKAMCGDTQPDTATLEAAAALAEEAVVLDPIHVEGRLQLAIAKALIVRPLPGRRGMRDGRAARQLAEAVLETQPDNAYAHGFLAVWHIEVVGRGGRIGAAVMGASIDQAHAHYARAAAILPGDASIHWQYARALATMNPKRFQAEIEVALAAARRSAPTSRVEQVMADRAATLSELMATGDRQVIVAAASEML